MTSLRRGLGIRLELSRSSRQGSKDVSPMSDRLTPALLISTRLSAGSLAPEVESPFVKGESANLLSSKTHADGACAFLLFLLPPFSLKLSFSDTVYLAPSGVQKERIQPNQIFVLPYPQPTIPTSGSLRTFHRAPKGLKESACTPLFWNAFTQREAGACIHTHSQHAGQSRPILRRKSKMSAQADYFLFRHHAVRLASHGHALVAWKGVHHLASRGQSFWSREVVSQVKLT